MCLACIYIYVYPTKQNFLDLALLTLLFLVLMLIITPLMSSEDMDMSTVLIMITRSPKTWIMLCYMVMSLPHSSGPLAIL